MKQIKNFEALLKCGFEWDEENQNYVYLYNGNDFIEVSLYGECYYKAHEFGYDFNFEEFNEYNNLLIEMTKAGCFDEPPKTLSELGWELYEYDSEMKCYLKKLDTYTTAYLTLELEYGTYYVYKYDQNEKFSYSVSNELHKAIMLEMEEQNENK